jgi:hypothetical protein
MKTKDFVQLERQLIQDLPGYTVSGPMIVKCPIDQVLRGLSFEGSSFDANTFFVWFFFLPLCIPTTHLYFNFGQRLRNSNGGDAWHVNALDLLSDLRAAISQRPCPIFPVLPHWQMWFRSSTCHSHEVHTNSRQSLMLWRVEKNSKRLRPL